MKWSMLAASTLGMWYSRMKAFSATESAILDTTNTTSLDNSNIVVVMLSQTDFDKVQTNIYLGTNESNSFLNLTYNAVSDMSDNPNTPVQTAVQAALVIPDNVPPVLNAIEVDMNFGQVILYYSEAINVDTFPISGVSLHNTSSPTPSFQLTNASEIISPSGSTVVIDINGDINPLRESMAFGADLSNTYITIAADTALDFSGNVAPPELSPRQPQDLQPDNRGPMLESFELDLNVGTLVLNFAETVNETSFEVSQILLQNARTKFDVIECVAITSSEYRRVDLSSIEVALTTRDVDELNLRPDLATGLTDTFISLTTLTVEDVLGNPAVEISIEDAQQISTYIRDEIRPNATAFFIDLNNNTITFMFDEVPSPSSVDLTYLTVQNSDLSPSLNYTFTSHTSARAVGRAIEIQLSQEDVNRLNALDLCSRMDNCYALVQEGFITDAAGNMVFQSGPLIAANFTTDAVPPTFEQFVLMDIDSGIMLLEFSETIDDTTVDLTTLRLQSASIGGGVDFTMLTLTGGRIVSGSSSQLEIQLSQVDLNAIKQDSFLCTRRTDCYVRFPSNFGRDTFGNVLPAVANTLMPDSTHYPLIYTGDVTGPILLSFDLDLEGGFLDLSFNEIFRLTSFDPTRLTLQDSPIATASYTLTDGTVLDSNDTGILLQLDTNDVLQIKGDPALATSASSTYMANTEELVEDIFRNPAFVRSGSNVLPVSQFVEDRTLPQFDAFQQFSQELLQISITFTEPIDVTTVNFSLITLQSEATGGFNLTLAPGRAELDDANPLLLIITLSLDDQFEIRQMSTLAVNRDTTYVSFETGAFSDPAGNVADGILPLQPTQFIPDTNPPRLAEFGLNMETGNLLLTYDDIIIPTEFNPLGITFQNDATRPDQSYTLTGGLLHSTEALGFVINATILRPDLEQLKYLDRLANGIDDTFIAADGTVTMRSSGGDVSATIFPAIQATSFIPDQTPPSILAFTLNLTSNILTLLANEPLDPASYNPSGFTLQNSPNITGLNVMSVSLTGGVAEQSTTSIFELNIFLSNVDTDMLKQMSDLATDPTNIFLSLSGDAISDFGGNRETAISGMNALNASAYGGDLTRPTVSAVSLDLNSGVLTITFSEVVDISIFDSSSIQLQTGISSGDIFNFASLTTLPPISVMNNLSNTIAFMITLSDLNDIKLDPEFGVAGSTFVTLDSDITVDSSGLSLLSSTCQCSCSNHHSRYYPTSGCIYISQFG